MNKRLSRPQNFVQRLFPLFAVSAAARRAACTRCVLEVLEERRLLSSFVVNSVADTDPAALPGGTVTLRSALNAANTAGGANTITFAAGLTISGAVTINLNHTLGALPDLNSNITLQGPGASLLTVQPAVAHDFGIFKIDSGRTVAISGLTIANGGGFLSGGVLDGGGVFNLGGNLTLSNDVLTGNTAAFGGGVCSSGVLALTNCSLTNNVVSSNGGGLISYATATITGTTLSGNTAVNGGGLETDSVMTMTNSTVANNTARNAGGIENLGSLTLTASTITGNTVSMVGGGLYNYPSYHATLKNNLIAGNSAVSSAPDISGALTSLGHNLIGNTSGGTGLVSSDLQNVSALLGALANNGGPTQTVALQVGSPAIGAADPSGEPSTDQRGALRKVAPDMGAVETEGTPVFSGLTASQTITYGTPSLTLAGTLAQGARIPIGDAVLISVANGTTPLTATATIQSDGTFSATLASSALAVTGSPHTVTYSYNASGANLSFNPTTDTSTAITVTPVTLNVTGITANNKVYDGTAAATAYTAGASMTGVLAADVGNVVLVVGDSSFADKNIGLGKTVTINLSLSGTAAGNYTLTGGRITTTANIAARTLTVTPIVQSKTYDGTTAVSLTLSDNRIAGDSLTVSDAAAAFLDKNVGTGKTVNVTGIALGGADAANYILASTSATPTGDIQPRSLTVTASAAGKSYCQTDPALTYTVSGGPLVGSDALSGTLVRAVGESIGTYPIGQGTVSAGSNYSLAYVGANFAITPITLSVVGITAGSKVYDGTTTATLNVSGATLLGVPLADVGRVTVDATHALGTFGDSNASSSKVVAISGLVLSGPAAANYTLTPPTTAAGITPRPLLITVDNKTKAFGQALPQLTATYSGFAVGDSVANLTVLPTWTVGATPASPVSGSPYSITASGAASSNYSISYVGGTLTVTPSPSQPALNGTGPLAIGQTLTLVATGGITDAGALNPTGSVSFREGNTLLGTVALDATGRAVFNAGIPGLGAHVYTATYSGDSNWSGGSVTMTQLVGDAPQRYVAQLYHDLLHRPADPGGLAAWTAQIYNGASYNSVGLAIAQSAEYQSNSIDALYVQYLGRHADAGGLAQWLALLQGGQSLDSIRAGILGSDEFLLRAGGTTTAYLTAVYQAVLNRAADPAGFAGWAALINGGSTSRAAVALRILNSDENLGDEITGWYQTFLQRSPEGPGLTDWESILRAGTTTAQIVGTFVSTPEYLALHFIA